MPVSAPAIRQVSSGNRSLYRSAATNAPITVPTTATMNAPVMRGPAFTRSRRFTDSSSQAIDTEVTGPSTAS